EECSRSAAMRPAPHRVSRSYSPAARTLFEARLMARAPVETTFWWAGPGGVDARGEILRFAQDDIAVVFGWWLG
ncbi:MAG: hypothetical protein WD333_09695, partial [Dehalococcoidia bacterium]